MAERKLIAHGPSSLTIALPYKWVKKYKLQKGDSIDIQEEDQGLYINPKPSERKKAISIDVSKHDEPSTITVLTSVYRRGYDQVKIQYQTMQEYQYISRGVNALLGFAIMENRKGTCLVQSLPSDLEQDFQTLFRRVFLILLQQLEDLEDVLSSPESLREFYRRDADLNAIVNLAIRMINKGYVHDRFQELYLCHVLLMIEECGDDITKFTIEVDNYKEAPKLKSAVERTTKMVRLLYDSYFKKTAGIMEFYKQYYLYWPGTKKYSAPLYDFFTKTKKNEPIFYLRSIVEKVIHMAEILLLPEQIRSP